jgi:hypothetical protein
MRSVCFSFLLLLLVTGFNSMAQVTSVPEEAKQNFAKQYPGAQNVEWENDVINVNVRFDLDGEKLNAEYNNKGIWKQTFKEWTFDRMPAIVQDGFMKSKYAQREVTEVVMIYYPGDVIRYRIKAEKNDIQKKYLYFNTKGRLVKESLTL